MRPCRNFAVILAAAGQEQPVSRQELQKAVRRRWRAGRSGCTRPSGFWTATMCKQLLLVISAEDREYFHFKFGANVAILGIDVVDGGAERADSVQKALARVKPEIDFVAFTTRPGLHRRRMDRRGLRGGRKERRGHSRPFRSPARSSELAADHTIDETVPRDGLWEAQTPQVFRRAVAAGSLRQARRLQGHRRCATGRAARPQGDDRAGSPINLKITTREDLRLAEQALKALPKPKLSGPAHPFADDDMWR